jgi:seryl-tRNA synthetase
MTLRILMLATLVATARGFGSTVARRPLTRRPLTRRPLTCRPLTRRPLTSLLSSTKDEITSMTNNRLSRQDLSLDQKTLVNHIDVVLSHLESRRASADTKEAAKQVAALNQRRVALIQQRDVNLNIRKETSAKVGMLMRNNNDNDNDNAEELEAAKLQSSQASELADSAEAELQTLEAEQNLLLAGIPNLLDDCVPDGTDESDNQVVSTWGTPGVYDFDCKWHDDVATGLGGYQAEAAVKMSGSRFVALSGHVARLERAIAMFLIDTHVDNHGYTEVSVPFIVSASALEGTSQLPKFKDDLFAITPESHTCNGEAAYLIPTAEVPVTNMHRDSVLEESDLPLYYVAYTPCFRAEAGSYGRDTKGLIRTHQFGKVELVKITTPEKSDEEHEALTRDAEACLQALKLPYRKVRLCSGDVGFSARHCYDLEVWLAGAAEYREISSCSNTGDFQARRMSLRYRPVPPPVDEGGGGKKKKVKKPKPVLCHTINGSGLAVGRTLVAVLENYQQADGSVVVPEVLRPYMGGLEKISPPAPALK